MLDWIMQDSNEITAKLSLNGHLVKRRLIFVTYRGILMNKKKTIYVLNKCINKKQPVFN